ncbi:pimeloyl-ACP methyl ester carboxylesterase [Ureibacillus xyleni]|uniref:Pimeloyl-ACP methyl ester carboxylesterase n=1 Tax=Ureibacillus xyleni TaxID=614648 RepID=A0A285TPR1_9BACL|nr:alpha/beta hydrolase [Ureibacillus xyleni]SOC25156.1 pimeloyl-ACP methyl ester carboxylesterase [Ureibacillus xyleni]
MPKVEFDNVQIHYEVRGHGVPILFLHGLGASWKMWAPQIDFFSPKYKMIMLDLRGHGSSTKTFPDNKFTARVMAEDVKNVLDALKITKTHLVGLSYGSVTAQLFASKYPEYIDKLVLSNGYSEVPTKISGWVLKASNIIFKMMSYDTIINLMLKVYGKDEFTKKILRDSFTFDKEMLILAKNSEFPTHTNELKQITVPTLVMGGDRKVMGVDERIGSQILFNHLPNATLALVKDAFDPISAMEKDIFNEMILDFFEGHPIKSYEGVSLFEKQIN